ncbi:MAG TPA: c-type cytochrome [Flavisolibacter sp.]|nr:c-type cytochrome [Flavisolibacter sp.]
MIFFKLIARKTALIGFVFFLSHTTVFGQAGRTLFQQYCQSCHAINKKLTGPALAGFTERGPWTEKANVYKWIHNPAAFIPTTPYTKALQVEYGQIMPGFPQLTEQEIDAIVEYINAPQTAPAPGEAGSGAAAAAEDSANSAVIFGIISIILAIIALILMQVNSNLKKLSDDKEGITRPDPVPFWRNKIYIGLMAIVLFVVGGYLVAKGAINLGRQQGYQPSQPIYFSHKVHAGINQINCLYCHGNAWESKHAAIPSLNVCMNCHKAISTYEKGPKLLDGEGNEINGTAEIQKLYDYAGFSEGQVWDPAKAKQIEWIKIHNLPDHVYFNHAQHIRVGKVQCQTCHGPVQDMDKVYQASDLSMGWCVNCHRETKVDFNRDSTGNQFYSIYEKFHNDIKAGKMDSVTVKDIGGINCQKCHY